MEFLKNQTFRQSIKFVKIEDPKMKLSLSVSMNCNHELSKDVLTSIEKNIKEMIILNYMLESENDKKKKEEEAEQKEEVVEKKKAVAKKALSEDEKLERILKIKNKL